MTGVEIIVAVIAALGGGGLFKIFDVFIMRKKNTFDEGAAFREEYRKRINDLEEDMEVLKTALREQELEKQKWQSGYNKLFYQFKEYQIKTIQILIKNGLDTDGLITDIEHIGHISM